MKKLITLGLILSSSLVMAESNCHFSIENKSEFLKEANELLASNIVGPGPLFESCSDVLNRLVARENSIEEKLKTLALFAKYKVPADEISNYFIDQEGIRTNYNLIRQHLRGGFSSEDEAFLEGLISYGVTIDHNRLRASESDINLEEAVSHIKKHPICQGATEPLCYLHLQEPLMKTYYQTIKNNNYAIPDELTSKLRRLLPNTIDASEFEDLIGQYEDEAYANTGTPLKQAALRNDLAQVKFLLRNGANPNEIPELIKLLSDEDDLDSLKGTPSMRDRNQVLNYLYNYALDKDLIDVNEHLSLCSQGILTSNDHKIKQDFAMTTIILGNILPLEKRQKLALKECRKVLDVDTTSTIVTDNQEGVTDTASKTAESMDALEGAFDNIPQGDSGFSTDENGDWENQWNQDTKTITES